MSSPGYDVIVVGAGLAGAAAAMHLSATAAVLVLEAGQPASGASGAAAGLANPFMGQRARPVWQMETALMALHATLAEADARALYRPGLLRPARDANQAATFRDTAAHHPRHVRWLGPSEVSTHWPAVHAPHGALYVEAGGALSVPAFVRALLAAAERRGASLRTGTRVTAWREADGHVDVDLAGREGPATFRTRFLILAPGDGFTAFAALNTLPLHRVKGQVIRLALPPGLDPAALPSLAGHGYVVPENDTLVAGSTYEHRFADAGPTPEASASIRAKATRMLPPLASAAILSATAGVRVTVRGTRLPLVGPLPGHRRTWVFTGLGSKGLLMAPLLAQRLPHFLRHPEAIPPELHPLTSTG
ncbi:MAG: glycine oxidase [Rhodothermaceae bacterium]|nr:MAG: FAD-dependent oxidoreductase [Bacteroidota bacterium]GIV61985.1 MAG: glycine oxidase [Rhodothermaceae bacterium]